MHYVWVLGCFSCSLGSVFAVNFLVKCLLLRLPLNVWCWQSLSHPSGAGVLCCLSSVASDSDSIQSITEFSMSFPSADETMYLNGFIGEVLLF